jgi:hypothetical protein
METREYIDEWTKEKAVTNWSSNCTTRRNQKLLSLTTEFMAKCQAKLGVTERTIDAETLIRDAFKKAFNVEFSETAFNNTLPAVVSAREAKRVEQTAKKQLATQLAQTQTAELAVISAWKNGHDAGLTDQKIYDDLVKKNTSKELLTKFFPNIAKK